MARRIDHSGNSLRKDSYHSFDKPRKIRGHYHFWFYDQMYRNNVRLIWNVNDSQIVEFVRQFYGEDVSDAVYDDKATMRTVLTRSGVPIIGIRSWHDDAENIALLAHECVHASGFILQQHGIEYDNREMAANEPHAYHIQFVFQKCLQALRVKK